MDMQGIKSSKQIALWSCPRSRSTLLARSFEQRDDCIMFDEPFYAVYLAKYGKHHPNRTIITTTYETDYKKVVEKLKKPLPENIRLGFQKHISKNVLPEFGTDWFPKHNIFLLRHPKEIIASLLKVLGQATAEDIDIASLYRIFQHLKRDPNTLTVVVHSDDLVKTPNLTLHRICEVLEIPFQASMLKWEKGLIDSKLFFSGRLLPYADNWYGNIKNSTDFQPYRAKDIHLPDHFQTVIEACMPIYRELLTYCL